MADRSVSHSTRRVSVLALSAMLALSALFAPSHVLQIRAFTHLLTSLARRTDRTQWDK
jgi:hypothetical protein